MSRIIDETLKCTGGERGFLLLINEKGRLDARVARTNDGQQLGAGDLRTSQTIVNRVLKTGKPIHIGNLLESEFWSADSVQELQLVSVMCVPLFCREPVTVEDRNFRPLALPTLDNGVMGAIYVDSPYVAKTFVESDLFAFEALANNATTAIINAQLFVHYRQEAEYRQEMNVARGVQQRLLPHQTPELPGLEITGWCQSCAELGGDYYDYVPVGENQLAVIIGDVSGHGLGSALLMATARAFLRALLDQFSDLSEVFSRLNQLLKRDSETRMFMTLCLVLIDIPKRQFRYINAGHDYPLLYRRMENRFEELTLSGPALGFIDVAEYEVSKPIALDDDDILTMTTDGIWEERSEQGTIFGRERIQTLIKTHRDCPVAEIGDRIDRALSAFLGEKERSDDMTVTLIKAVEQ